MEFADLLLDNGELIRVSFQPQHLDDFYEVLESTMKTKSWLSVGRWDGTTAEYMNNYIFRINMGRVVALL